VRRRAVLAFVLASTAACSSEEPSTPAGAHVAEGGAPAATTFSSTPVPQGPAPAIGTKEQGIATYYAATGAGNCGYDATPNDLMVAAMNAEEYANSAACGTCVAIDGPKGSVTVRVVDQCPECKKGHLDLSKEAFEKIADVSAGRVDISWTPVRCAYSGPVAYHIKDGSSQYWTAIQVRNHALPIDKLELSKGGSAFAPVTREDYNYFVADKGAGPAPYRVRITAAGGATLEDDLPAPVENATIQGHAQFP
jgi:expansin (peptidoglycan-binding protein)